MHFRKAAAERGGSSMILRTATYCIFITICALTARSCGRQSSRGGRAHYRNALHRQISNVDVRDKIVELQCYAKCEQSAERSESRLKYDHCLQQCQAEVVRAPRRGYCPSMQNAIFQNISPLQRQPCLDNCSYDFDCPEVQKCCASACGPVCTDAIGVRDDSLLPPIPTILKYQLPRGHRVEITLQSSANSTYFCHVEARYHIGSFFSPRKLGVWQWQPVEKIAEISDSRSMRTEISFNLRPGRWYQVRVAAINSYGFRGYSEPSRAFTLPNHPKPPRAPVDLKVVSSHFDGKHCSVKVVWCASKSNLPIEKYKIIWSLYVKSKDESLISSEAYVKDRHQFEITNLIPDSSYYIQVQAMAINGRRRLKSDKLSVLYNTTTISSSTRPSSSPALKCARNRRTSVYEGNRVDGHEAPGATQRSDVNSATTSATSATSATEPLAAPFEPHEEKVYELCPLESNCEAGEYNAIRVNKNSLVFSKLNFNTTYTFKPRLAGARRATFTFTTPKCENFRKGFPKADIVC